MMNKNEFLNYQITKITNLIKEKNFENADIKAEAINVVKYNDQELTGIRITLNDSPSSTTFYIDDAYDSYLDGTDKDQIAREFAESFERAVKDGPRNDMNNANALIDKPITLRVVEAKRNKKFLQNVPYMSVDNGLVLICDIRIGSHDGGTFTTIVNDDVLNLLGKTKQEVFAEAINSASSIDEPVFYNMRSKLYNEYPENLLKSKEPLKDLDKMYVLTNESTLHGAAALFYPEMQKRVSEILGEGYYALPSSTEEFIILPESCGIDVRDLTKMVHDANRSFVRPEDVLSDKVLKYDTAIEKLVDVSFGRSYESRVSETR